MPVRLAAVGMLVAMMAAGCADVGERALDERASPGDEQVAGELLVFAPASLGVAFAEVADRFAAAHPDVEVVLNVAGSQQLAGQIFHGAPADVFASANPDQMAVVADAGRLDGPPRHLATNRLAIAVEPGNPLRITGLADLARDDIVVVLAAEEVPAGAYAREVLRAAGIEVTPASLETDVRGVRTKVALGEADAGIVFASDLVAAGGRLGHVALPDRHNVTATYLIGTLADAPRPAAAAAFVAFARSAAGQAVLADHGFGPP